MPVLWSCDAGARFSSTMLAGSWDVADVGEVRFTFLASSDIPIRKYMYLLVTVRVRILTSDIMRVASVAMYLTVASKFSSAAVTFHSQRQGKNPVHINSKT